MYACHIVQDLETLFSNVLYARCLSRIPLDCLASIFVVVDDGRKSYHARASLVSRERRRATWQRNHGCQMAVAKFLIGMLLALLA